MNIPKILGQVRHIIAALGVTAVNTDGSLVVSVTGGALAIGMAIWSYFSPEKSVVGK